MYEAVDGAEALIIHTDWTMFRTPDFDRLKSRLKKPVIFDGRNLYNPAQAEEPRFYLYLYRQQERVTVIRFAVFCFRSNNWNISGLS